MSDNDAIESNAVCSVESPTRKVIFNTLRAAVILIVLTTTVSQLSQFFRGELRHLGGVDFGQLVLNALVAVMLAQRLVMALPLVLFLLLGAAKQSLASGAFPVWTLVYFAATLVLIYDWNNPARGRPDWSSIRQHGFWKIWFYILAAAFLVQLAWSVQQGIWNQYGAAALFWYSANLFVLAGLWCYSHSLCLFRRWFWCLFTCVEVTRLIIGITMLYSVVPARINDGAATNAVLLIAIVLSMMPSAVALWLYTYKSHGVWKGQTAQEQ